MKKIGDFSTHANIRLFQTDEGFLHKTIYDYDPASYDEDDKNYSFTNNPLDAYECYSWKSVPKELVRNFSEPINNWDDLCKVMDGKMVLVNVNMVVEWKVLAGGRMTKI